MYTSPSSVSSASAVPPARISSDGKKVSTSGHRQKIKNFPADGLSRHVYRTLRRLSRTLYAGLSQRHRNLGAERASRGVSVSVRYVSASCGRRRKAHFPRLFSLFESRVRLRRRRRFLFFHRNPFGLSGRSRHGRGTEKRRTSLRRRNARPRMRLLDLRSPVCHRQRRGGNVLR